jgi:LuxR family maltose regulon positive regulatory protein
MEALTVHGALLRTQGQLRDAFAVCQEALLLADASTRQQGRASPIVASVHRLSGRLFYEWDDLPAALRHVQQAIDLSIEWGGLEDTAFAYLELARVRQGMGDPRGALDAVRKGRQHAGKFSSWFGNYGAAQQARLSLIQGDLAAATQWAQESSLSPDDEPSFQYLLEYSVLSRILAAQGAPDRALALLDKLLDVAERASAGLPVIEFLLLKALSLHQQGRTEQARVVLARALELAEPEGLVRTFVDKGAPVGALLQEAARAGISGDYARKLLRALDKPTQTVSKEPPGQPLIEALSERELEVLRFLDTHLTTPQIAEELVVSRHTVRTHIKHIYEKLGAHSRADAVQRARELGLL